MNDSIKREQSDACIDSAERENYRTKCKKIMIIDGGPRKNRKMPLMRASGWQ